VSKESKSNSDSKVAMVDTKGHGDGVIPNVNLNNLGPEGLENENAQKTGMKSAEMGELQL
jgi:hypothetical protein